MSMRLDESPRFSPTGLVTGSVLALILAMILSLVFGIHPAEAKPGAKVTRVHDASRV